MAELSEQTLDAVPWDRLESIDPDVPPKEVRRALRRLYRKGPESTEDDCWALFDSLRASGPGISSVATAALPFVVALAADPRTGARATLVELLAFLSEVPETASPESVAPGWAEAWRQAHRAVQPLLADPDPAVRREAVPLADGPGRLLERWRTERDLSVRLPVLFALGRLAAAPGAETTTVTEIRAVLDASLKDPDPVLRVAAVKAYAGLDTEVPVRELDPLVEALTDPAARSRWGTVWYERDSEHPFDRETVAYWTADLFDDTPAQELGFLTRLSSAADSAGDADLLRTVLDRCVLLLISRRSVEPAVLPLAGAALPHPDPSVRIRAAHLLGILGRRAAAYADQLAGLLDDSGEEEFNDATVSDHACWALTRMHDPRALPGLVDRLCAPFHELDGGSYGSGEPRRPEIAEVLGPLRAHAAALLPSICEELRRNLNDPGAPGVLTTDLLAIVKAWETDALPALPEVTAYVSHPFRGFAAIEALVAMGPAAASAAPVLRERMSLEPPNNHPWLYWALWRIGGADDPAQALRAVGETLSAEGEEPRSGMVGHLTAFGAVAAPYTDRVRHALTAPEGWIRTEAAIALWSITGDPGLALPTLEEEILAFAAGGQWYGPFGEALRTLIRFRTLTPAIEAALRLLRDQDHRLSPRADYRAVLQDEELRALIDEALTCEPWRDRE
ncbi:hypothetical protein OG920_38540 [Streptomyces europaeiscabiei]|uniref:hypothetical protein n=1 Tax=Streptomyces europaeiscabiei TaxID=146819 RepID=UPI0029BDA939|nr:hypothetical protein [Streptomyces europaeiscabiei]MDX3615863.1 hypothetical protein [Streptomyces europaeiscabiei]